MKKIITCILFIILLSPLVLAADEYGQLTVTSQKGPYEIHIDGKKIGETPLRERSIAAGEHLLKIVDNRPFYTVIEETILVKTIHIKAYETTTIKVEEEMGQADRHEDAPIISSDLSSPLGYKKDISQSLLEVEYSSYSYKEPGLMSLTGPVYGIIYSNTVISHKDITKYEGRYFMGTMFYDGALQDGTPLTISDIPDSGYELSILRGSIRPMSDTLDWTPYSGIGYRYLNDNMQMKSQYGYQRESHYYYFPLGIIISNAPFERRSFETIIEYDFLITGKQISHLSDVAPIYPDFINWQHSGYGIKCIIRFTRKIIGVDWVGKIFWRAWDIQDSDVVWGLYEPKNNTSAVGFAVGTRF